jgi:Asp-tRNA(Asn)/Glu-tRNA(Gln) amidotransferase A subunit family amidase
MSDPGQEPNWLTATELGALYRRGALSPHEAVAASFRRVEAIDPGLNAFCALDRDRAMADARASETRFRRGEPIGALDGVPVAIKDLTPTAGLRTAFGSCVHAENIPAEDAIVVERLRAAGAVIVGKTTTSEFANASVTDSPLTGTTRNPWDPDRTSGGSSGGSAVAVATGCVPLAEGSDMGGSVRIPACFCGVVGLKPSLGRIPFALLPNLYDPLAHHGPIARSVADARLFLAATAGPDERDPMSLPADRDGFEADLPDLRGRRVAFSADLGFVSVESCVADNARAALVALEAAGVRVEDVSLDLSAAVYEAGYKLFAALMTSYHGHLEETHGDLLDPTLLEFFAIGRSLSVAELMESRIAVSHEWRKLAKLFATYDALACPTMPRTATPVGRTEFDYAGHDERGRTITFDMTFPFNLFGHVPAISVPSGLGPDGMPTGLQIAGRRHSENFVLAMAGRVHDAARWTDRLKALGPWPRQSRPGTEGERAR